MTSHPKDLSTSLVDAIKNLDKVCNHLHLPFQSGSSRILEKMNRRYTKDGYLKLVENIKEQIPGIALTTDVIVGFPGETEEDFLDTLDVIKRVGYESAYMFIYSKRTGTPAATMDNQIPEELKKERFQRLVDLQNSISEQISKQYEGRVVKVLVEGISKENSEMYTGRTSTNKIVNFPSKQDLTGKLVNIEIIRSGAFWLEGKII